MEIKPQELRIGNYYIDDRIDHLFVAKEIRSNCIEHGDSDYSPTSYRYIKGIEITPDWLEKFGFKLVESNELEYYEIYINGINLYEGDKNGFMEVILSGHEESVRVRYVHQLQNLYFALTGKELAIDNKSL